MANSDHYYILERGVHAWNRWRQDNPDVKPDLSGFRLLYELNYHTVQPDDDEALVSESSHLAFRRIDFSGTNLSGLDLRKANLAGANLTGAEIRYVALDKAYLSEADLRNAQLEAVRFQGANLSYANLEGVDLRKVNLSAANLFGANLRNVDLSGGFLGAGTILIGTDLENANLRGAYLAEGDLSRANLKGADLHGANLNSAILVQTNLEKADISGCSVFGVSVWRAKLAGARQSDLVITSKDEPTITVDNLEVAQFIYLLLNNEKIREVIDTISSKAVLILGRFSPERKAVLDAIRGALRNRDLLPILFDFDKPRSRDLTETISTLAHMVSFIIADITDPQSIPQELQAIVPNLPSVVVQPILHSSKNEYGMFEHFKKYPWVKDIFRYTHLNDVVNWLDTQAVHFIARKEAV